MADPLRTYKAGELLSVRTVNELTRRAKRGGQFSGPQLAGPQTGSTVLYMRNAGGSSDDCPRYGVLGIDGVAIDHENNEDQFLNQIVLDGVVPEGDASSDTGHTGKFAIALEPIAVGDVGRVVVAGAVQVQINVIDEDHKFADVSDGDNTQLESAETGAARILWKEEGSGAVWAVVLIGAGGGGVTTESDSGTHEGQKHQMVTDNQTGWRLSFFCPGDSSLLP